MHIMSLLQQLAFSQFKRCISQYFYCLLRSKLKHLSFPLNSSATLLAYGTQFPDSPTASHLRTLELVQIEPEGLSVAFHKSLKQLCRLDLNSQLELPMRKKFQHSQTPSVKMTKKKNPKIVIKYSESKLKFERQVMVQSLSHVGLFATPWTIACQAPLSMGFSCIADRFITNCSAREAPSKGIILAFNLNMFCLCIAFR